MESVRRMRREKGLSQQELADLADVGQDSISAIETGKHEPHPRTLRKLADALGVEVAEFFKEPALAGKDEAPDTYPGRREKIEDVDKAVEALGHLEDLILRRAKKVRADLRLVRTRDLEALEDFCVNTIWHYNGMQQSIKDQWGDPTDRRTPAPVRKAIGNVHDAMIHDLGDVVSKVIRAYEDLPEDAQVIPIKKNKHNQSTRKAG